MIVQSGRNAVVDEENRLTYDKVEFVGCWSFSEDLRIELSASRELVRTLPWYIRSLIQFTTYKACVTADHPLARLMIERDPVPFDMEFIGGVPALGTLMEDSVLNSEEGWLAVSILRLKDTVEQGDQEFEYSLQYREPPQYREIKTTYQSVADVRQRLASGLPIRPDLPPFKDIASIHSEVDFADTLSAALTRISLGVSWARNEDRGVWEYVITEPAALPISDGERGLPPLYFVPYVGHDGLRAGQGPLNRNHPFSEWLMGAIA